jgi:ankyrin repeat protein
MNSTISINHKPVYSDGDANIKNEWGIVPSDDEITFVAAVREKQYELIYKLSKQLANSRDSGNRPIGKTALMVASAIGDLNIVTNLLNNNAEIDAVDFSIWGCRKFPNRNCRTALYYAICGNENAEPEYGQSGHREIVQYLIALGAKLNIRNGEGLTPLHCAVISGQEMIVELLISKGANVDVNTSGLGTPLHFACSLALYDRDKAIMIAEILLNNGADINSKAHDTGWTPLHYGYEFPLVYDFLCSKGARKDIVDNDGDSVEVIRKRLGMD